MIIHHTDQLSFLPFSETWQMRIDIPYSLMVRDGDMLWSCGQCPLDRSGAVLFPGDLRAQAAEVVNFIDEFTVKMGAKTHDVGRLTVYYVPSGVQDGADLITIMRDRFGADTLVTLVPVPHFYYDGMMIEVDVYATTKQRSFHHFESDCGQIVLEINETDTQIWGNFTISETAVELGQAKLSLAISQLLERSGIQASEVLFEHWIVGKETLLPALAAVRDLKLADARLSAVMASYPDNALLGEITCVKGGGRRIVKTVESEGAIVELSLRRFGQEFSLTAAVTSGADDMLSQMRATMPAVANLLDEEGLPFSAVRKSTTLYVAGSSAEELHDNMSIRNAYYSKPGPGSTGLPVAGFPFEYARNSLTLVGRTH